jgi:dihydroxyacetone kinase
VKASLISYFLSILLGAFHGFGAFSGTVVGVSFFSSTTGSFLTSAKVLFMATGTLFGSYLRLVSFFVNVTFLAIKAAASAGAAAAASAGAAAGAVAFPDALPQVPAVALDPLVPFPAGTQEEAFADLFEALGSS